MKRGVTYTRPFTSIRRCRLKTLSPPLMFLGGRRVSLVLVALIIVWTGQTEGGRGTYSKKTAPLTWQYMTYYLPASATKSGDTERFANVYKDPVGWGDSVRNQKLKSNVKLPAVVYLHGCGGLKGAGDRWGPMLAVFGFVVFQPDSFARPGRVELCGDGDMTGRQLLRIQEIKYAVSQMRELPWVDQDRLVLMGFSEGAQAVAVYRGREFVAHIFIGTDCRHGGGKRRGIPALNIVGSADELGYGGGCGIWRDKRGSKRVIIGGAPHDVSSEPEALAAVSELLEKCCGKAPTKSAAADLNVHLTAERIVEEYGNMAPLHALLKSDEALAMGDRTGQKTWLGVREATLELLKPQ